MTDDSALRQCYVVEDRRSRPRDSMTQTYRSWAPGDGLQCQFAKQAPASTPCGPPSVVRLTERPADETHRYGAPVRRSVLCAHHASSDLGVRPWRANANAEKVARETVLTAHWDEYQEALRAAIEDEMESMLEGLPDGLKAVIRQGLSAHDDGADGAS